jgi:hypothetical protein
MAASYKAMTMQMVSRGTGPDTGDIGGATIDSSLDALAQRFSVVQFRLLNAAIAYELCVSVHAV